MEDAPETATVVLGRLTGQTGVAAATVKVMVSDVGQKVASAFEGCYEAPRAAALSGVPVSTVYHWARKGVVVPSVSASTPRRWSYADLMALRIVSWLRHPKDRVGDRVLASPMAEVRRGLDQLADLGLDVWSDTAGSDRSPLWVERDGRIVIVSDDGLVTASGEGRLDVLNLLGPFEVDAARGPNLVRPRPLLRIVPGKVGGEPHVKGSRLTTLTLAALASQGYSAEQIAALYPDEDPEALLEAVELEATLDAGSKVAA